MVTVRQLGEKERGGGQGEGETRAGSTDCNNKYEYKMVQQR